MADNHADDLRWTVRGVPPEVRKVASEAADRAGVTVGAWLCKAVDLAVQSEREPAGALRYGVADKPSDRVADAVSLAVLERVVASAVTLAEAKRVPVEFRRRANKLLLAALPEDGGEAPLLLGG